MRRKWFILAVAFYSVIINAQGTDTLKIENCLKMANNRSPASRQKILYGESFNSKIKNINTNWYPAVGFSAQATYNSETTDFSEIMGNSLPFSIPSQPKDQYKIWADINQQLYDGGASKAMKAAERAGYDIELQQTESDLLVIRQQVSQMFFSLLLTQKSSEILHISIGELSERKKVLQAGVNHGIILQENLMAMDAEEIALQQKLTELELSRQQFIAALSILIDTTLTNDLVFAEPAEISATNESAIRPELLTFERQKDLLLANQKLVTSGDYPKLFAFSQIAYGRPGYNMVSSDFHTFYSVGAGLKWNFLNYGDSKRQKKLFEIQKDIIDVKRDNFNDQLEIQLQKERTNIEKYESFMKQDEQIIILRKAIAARSLSRLNNGTITSADYLVDMNAEIVAKLQLENHKVLKMQSSFNYILLQGKL